MAFLSTAFSKPALVLKSRWASDRCAPLAVILDYVTFSRSLYCEQSQENIVTIKKKKIEKNCFQPLTKLELPTSARGKKALAFSFSPVFYQIFPVNYAHGIFVW